MPNGDMRTDAARAAGVSIVLDHPGEGHTLTGCYIHHRQQRLVNPVVNGAPSWDSFGPQAGVLNSSGGSCWWWSKPRRSVSRNHWIKCSCSWCLMIAVTK